jgi:hypothetical protein
MLRPLLAAAAALALAACAAQTAGDGAARDCFRTLDVSGYGVLDEHRIRVSINPQREYYLTVRHNTRDLDWTQAITLRSTTSFICVGNGLGVEVMGGNPPVPYPVVNIERAPLEAPTGS